METKYINIFIFGGWGRRLIEINKIIIQEETKSLIFCKDYANANVYSVMRIAGKSSHV